MDAWGSGLFSIIVSVFSLIFYGIDAVFSVVRAIRKDNTTLNIIIVALFVVCLILGVWVISSYLRNYKTIVWFISYFSLFIIELISIIRCFVRKNQKTETSSIIWCHLKRSPTTKKQGSIRSLVFLLVARIRPSSATLRVAELGSHSPPFSVGAGAHDSLSLTRDFCGSSKAPTPTVRRRANPRRRRIP